MSTTPNKNKPNNGENKKGVLLGSRILRDFSKDYNKNTPIYFVGIITEYQPSTKAKDLITVFPSTKTTKTPTPKKSPKKSQQQAVKPKKLDNGLYRITYLDSDKDEVSPAEAHAGIDLYNTYVGKVQSTSVKHYFDRALYPNPTMNTELMSELVQEEKYYYECYKDYLEKQKIDPVTIIVPNNDDDGEKNGDKKDKNDLILTEYGYIPSKSFDEGSMKRYGDLSSPVKKKATPRKRGTKRSVASATKSEENSNEVKSPAAKKAKVSSDESDSKTMKSSTSESVEPMDVAKEEEKEDKKENDKVEETKQPQDKQIEPKTVITKEEEKKDNEEEKGKKDETIKKQLILIDEKLKRNNDKLEELKSRSSPDTAKEIDDVMKQQDKEHNEQMQQNNSVATTTKQDDDKTNDKKPEQVEEKKPAVASPEKTSIEKNKTPDVESVVKDAYLNIVQKEIAAQEKKDDVATTTTATTTTTTTATITKEKVDDNQN